MAITRFDDNGRENRWLEIDSDNGTLAIWQAPVSSEDPERDAQGMVFALDETKLQELANAVLSSWTEPGPPVTH